MDIRKELSDKEIKQRTKDIDYICKDECGQYDICGATESTKECKKEKQQMIYKVEEVSK